MNTRKVAFHTLGCKLNFSETSSIQKKFREEGYTVVDFNDQADVYVINTCSVTEAADKKCRQAIHKVHNNHPGGTIAVVGCYSQLKAEDLSQIPGVNLVLGTKEKYNVLEYLKEIDQPNRKVVHSCEIETVEQFHPAHSDTDRTRSFLKVQDGCDYNCTYCTIPLARGKSRNASIDKLVDEAKEIAGRGIKEIILTGVNIGDFGRSTNEQLTDLIRALEKVDGIERYRISSVEPNLLKDEIIEFVSSSDKFLPHFHIPLQSGTDEILSKMKRRYNISMFRDRVERIKKEIPDAFIGVDVIVGFPGETKALFMKTKRLLKELPVSYYHVFSYSERPKTPSVLYPGKVPKYEIKQRSKELQSLADQKQHIFFSNHLGKPRSVLFEYQKRGNRMYGFTDNYIKVSHPYEKELVGKIVSFQLVEISKKNIVTGKIER